MTGDVMSESLNFDILGLLGGEDSESAREYRVEGDLRIFAMVSPWYYVLVPREYSADLSCYKRGSLIAVRVFLGGSVWDTSLMPVGKSEPAYEHFVPIKAAIRRAEGIDLGDTIALTFTLRDK